MRKGSEGVRSKEYRVERMPTRLPTTRLLITHYSLPALRWIALTAILLAAALWLWRGSGLFPGPDRTWEAMQARGTWRVGMDPAFPPFESLDASGAPVGFDVALARQMAGAWGLQVEIVAMGYDGLLDALIAGKLDSIVSAFPLDPRMTEDVAFSAPYFDAGIFLAVKEPPTGLAIAGPADLPSRTVAVEWGGAGDAVGRQLQRHLISTPTAASDPTAPITFLPFETQAEALAALLAGQADAALVDGVSLKIAQGQGAPLISVGPALESNPYVIAAPIAAHLLQEKIADTLSHLQAQGALTHLESEWFTQ